MTQTYFLGANSANGFYSSYDCFCAGNDDFLYIIKGAPGSGKSTFMKKIGAAAENAGLDVQYVRCSGDPASLDGVYLPQRHLGYVDGTAPHIIEPTYPGISGCYLNFSRFFDISALRSNAEAIRRLNAEYKAAYQSAYRCLAAHRLKPQQAVVGARRFRHAVTCQGVVALPAAESPKLISDVELSELLKKDGMIAYLHPILPGQVIGALDASKNEYFEMPFEIPNCADAISFLKEAKRIHDELEACYRPHVDFNGIDDLLTSHLKKALSDEVK